MPKKEIIRADSQIVAESRGNSHAWLRVLRHPSPLWPTGGQEKWKTKTLKENTAHHCKVQLSIYPFSSIVERF
jgi:hypothetical protein